MKRDAKHNIITAALMAVLAVILAALMLGTAPAWSEGLEFHIDETAGIQVSCTPPTARTDGTALAADELAGFRFYATQDIDADLAGKLETECKWNLLFSDLTPGQYYVYAKAEDTGGRVSGRSNPYPFVLLPPVAPPNAPVMGTEVQVLPLEAP